MERNRITCQKNPTAGRRSNQNDPEATIRDRIGHMMIQQSQEIKKN